MNSNDKPDGLLDFNTFVTPGDVAALRQLRSESPSWLLLDWRVIDALVPPGALDRRPTADDRWRPFVLDPSVRS